MHLNFITKKLIGLMPKIGGKIILEPNYQYSGCIIFDDGNRTFYKGSSFDINPHGAVKIAIDKGYANYFLDKFGFNIPTYDTFANEALNEYLDKKKGIKEGFLFASKLGFPVIIKPNEGTKGTHVYKIHNEVEYFEFANQLFADSKVMLIQKFVTGNDYRIVVFDDKVYCAYQRIPLHIIGNGRDPIATLLKQKTQELKNKQGSSAFKLGDKRIQAKLNNENLSYDFVPDKGQLIPLLNLANLSLGGQGVDYTKTISKAYKQLVIDLTKKMGLRLCGIDIMSNSIEGSPDDYSIIEINSAPGHSNFALLGDTQSKIIDNLYVDILIAIKNQKKNLNRQKQ